MVKKFCAAVVSGFFFVVLGHTVLQAEVLEDFRNIYNNYLTALSGSMTTPKTLPYQVKVIEDKIRERYGASKDSFIDQYISPIIGTNGVGWARELDRYRRQIVRALDNIIADRDVLNNWKAFLRANQGALDLIKDPTDGSGLYQAIFDLGQHMGSAKYNGWRRDQTKLAVYVTAMGTVDNNVRAINDDIVQQASQYRACVDRSIESGLSPTQAKTTCLIEAVEAILEDILDRIETALKLIGIL